MIVGRPDNKIGNATYPIGNVSTGVVANYLRKIRYYYQMLLGTN